MKNKKMTRKMGATLIVVIIIILTTLLFLYSWHSTPQKYNGKESKDVSALSDNDSCTCVERERFECSNETWHVDYERRSCVNGNQVTNVLLGCSSYECPEGVYSFDNNTNKFYLN